MCWLLTSRWNVPSLVGKELKLVHEVEQCQLDIFGLTSTHTIGSETRLLERAWTLTFSGEKTASIGLLTNPWLSAVLEFSLESGRSPLCNYESLWGRLCLLYVFVHQVEPDEEFLVHPRGGWGHGNRDCHVQKHHCRGRW